MKFKIGDKVVWQTQNFGDRFGNCIGFHESTKIYIVKLLNSTNLPSYDIKFPNGDLAMLLHESVLDVTE